MAGQLEDKISLVTGGGRGIGEAAALAFAREGARVVVADQNPEWGERTARLIRERGGEAVSIDADVSQAVQVEGLINRIVERYGRLDCAHNNAAIGGMQVPIDEHTEEGFDRTMAVNVKGVWLCMKYQIPQMLRQGGGAIVNMASAVGLTGGRNISAYSASKHAVVGLTKSAALEYASKGVRINCVCPGATRTPINVEYWEKFPRNEQENIDAHPVGRVAAPEEIAEAVVWLCTDQASFVHGAAMSVDGGLTAQ